MKILHLALGLEISGGGGNRAPAELCETLAALGHDVSVFTLEHGTHKCFKPRGIRIHRFETRGLGKVLEHSPALKCALEREIPICDIVHLHSMWRWPNLRAARICRKHRVPYVVQTHGSLSPWALRHKRLRKLLWGRLFERRVLEHAAFVHAESEMDREAILAYLPSAKTIVSPCGAYREVFEGDPPGNTLTARWPQLAGKTVLLFLSRIDVMKGLDLLIPALARVAPSYPDLALLVVGPDSAGLVPGLMRLARDLEIEDRVVWGGPVWGDERLAIMKQADVYVHPSMSDNFGISVLEAMFCASPILTTTATPWSELAALDAGIVVESSVDGLGNGLRHVLAMTKPKRKQMGQNARQLALEKYEWEPIARTLVEHYKRASCLHRQRSTA